MKPVTKYILLSLLFLLIIASCLYGLLLFSIYYVEGPGFKTLTIQNNSLNNKGDEIVYFEFVTVGHIRNRYRRDLPPDNKGYSRHGLSKIVNHELAPENYFDEKFIKVLPDIKDLQPDMLFITGDVLPLYTIDIFENDDGIRDSVKEREIMEYCWDMTLPVLKEATNHVVIIPGNHDIYGATAEMVFREKVGYPFFSFAKNNLRFVILNSVRKDTTGAYNEKWTWPANITKEQISFLKNGLTSEWKEDFIFLFVHNGPMRIPNWMNEIHPLLVGSNCQTVFSGTRPGTCDAEIKDGIAYLDGGFDNLARNNPSYYFSTTVWNNGKIQHSVHYVLPSKIGDKIQVIQKIFGVMLHEVVFYAKQHYIKSLFLFIVLIVSFLFFGKLIISRRRSG